MFSIEIFRSDYVNADVLSIIFSVALTIFFFGCVLIFVGIVRAKNEDEDRFGVFCTTIQLITLGFFIKWFSDTYMKTPNIRTALSIVIFLLLLIEIVIEIYNRRT